MPSTGTQVMDKSRAYLNDSSGELYTDSVLLPYLQTSYTELQEKLEAQGIQVKKEVSSVIDVALGSLTLTLPADFVSPIKLEERPDGSSDLFEEMIEREWEPNLLQNEILRYWVWRENEIKFLGATTNREVRLYYLKSFTPITAANVQINSDKYLLFLAYKTAEHGARFIGENATRANELRADAEMHINRYLETEVKKSQALPKRRKGWGYSFRARRIL